jgi:hypothetical protein
VNHDNSDFSTWQSSSTSVSALLSYDPPVIQELLTPDGSNQRPMEGQFIVTLLGSNFGAFTPVITVGGRPCPVVSSAERSHESVQCVAPRRDMTKDTTVVRLVQVDSASNDLELLYDAPVVTGTSPPSFSALPAIGDRVSIGGLNFGTPPLDRSNEPLHVVTIGYSNCSSVEWVSDSLLSCMPRGVFAAGEYAVSVTFLQVRVRNPSLTASGSRSTGRIVALCPPGFFGRAGEQCMPCPKSAVCTGGGMDPVSLPGFYPISRTDFTMCQPMEACLGNVSRSAIDSTHTSVARVSSWCTSNYVGERCAECAFGSYRVKAECRKCPNTAWLLFFAFAVTITASVAAAVYLSKRNIQFAGLSIGVVSTRR